MNNDTSNIIILSPSYHRIIHKAKPHFDNKALAFEFPKVEGRSPKQSRKRIIDHLQGLFPDVDRAKIEKLI